MRRICAWCRKGLGGAFHANSPITHGICGSCAEAWQADDIRDRIQELAGAVLVLDSDGRILDTTRQAAHALGPDPPLGLLFGEALVCRNASLPGGCGQTGFCATCALRGAFEETAQTGTAIVAAEATIARTDADVTLTLTTERVGATVLMRLDDVDVKRRRRHARVARRRARRGARAEQP